MVDVSKILASMRGDQIRPGTSGRWSVRHVNVTENWQEENKRLHAKGLLPEVVPVGLYTMLFCQTQGAISTPKVSPPKRKNFHVWREGELVMNDFPGELKKHLNFVLRARGRVLVTGLGMGCVVRGLLAAGNVQSIDVVERSSDVIKLCGCSVSDSRVRLRHVDALSILDEKSKYDFAWHDLWADPDASEPHLQCIHSRLIAGLASRVRVQGAWAMPRFFLARPRRKLRTTRKFYLR